MTRSSSARRHAVDVMSTAAPDRCPGASASSSAGSAAERQPPGDGLVEHAAERVQIRARIAELPSHLLRRHVRGRPGRRRRRPRCARGRRRSPRESRPEVHQHGRAVAAQEYVRRLEVAVHDAARVQERERSSTTDGIRAAPLAACRRRPASSGPAAACRHHHRRPVPAAPTAASDCCVGEVRTSRPGTGVASVTAFAVSDRADRVASSRAVSSRACGPRGAPSRTTANPAPGPRR